MYGAFMVTSGHVDDKKFESLKVSQMDCKAAPPRGLFVPCFVSLCIFKDAKVGDKNSGMR